MASIWYAHFDSTPEDKRILLAEDWAKFNRSLVTDGIRNGGSCLEVFAGEDYYVHIHAGIACIQGYIFRIESDEDGDYIAVKLETPHPNHPRIDRVVLCLDRRIEKREISIKIKCGEANPIPVPPDLVRNNNIWELSLANVYISAGKSTVVQTDITDERFETDVCGLMNSVLGLDPSNWQRQFDEYMMSIDSGVQDAVALSDQSFKAWFSTIKQAVPRGVSYIPSFKAPSMLEKAPMPYSRMGGASHFYNGNIYIFYGAIDVNYGIRKVCIYNIENNSWTTASREVNYERIAPIVGSMSETMLFITGGSSPDKISGNLPHYSETFDLTTGIFTYIGTSSKERTRACGGQIGNFVYVHGGTNTTNTQLYYDGEAYNTLTKTWGSKPPSLYSYHYSEAMSCVYNNILYVFGGYRDADKSLVSSVMHSFTQSSNKWELVSLAVQTARYGAGVCLIGSKMYVIGGKSYTGNVLDLVESYDFETSTWRKECSLDVALFYPTVTAVDNQIYIFGGQLANGTTTNKTWVYLPETKPVILANEDACQYIYYNANGDVKAGNTVIPANEVVSVPHGEIITFTGEQFDFGWMQAVQAEKNS